MIKPSAVDAPKGGSQTQTVIKVKEDGIPTKFDPSSPKDAIELSLNAKSILKM